MSFAQGSRSQLLVKAQPDYLTQATGNFLTLPFSSHSLDLSKSTVESQTVRSDREVSDFRHGNIQIGGSIEVEMRFGDAATELLLQSAMFNVWASNEMGVGTQRTFLSIEDGMLDAGIYRMFTGCEVSRFALNIQPGEIVKGTFDIIGRNGAVAGSSSGGTPVAASTNVPMDAFSGFVYDQFPSSGAELAVVAGLEITVDNGLQPTFVVGTNVAPFQEYGRGRITGQMQVYAKDSTFLSRFINETEVPLLVQVADPSGNDYVFYMPRCKYTGAQLPHQSEQSRMITVPFVALKPTSGTVTSALRIQK